ncbi:MAG: SIR2 family protein [Bacteroidota bacterium]
MESVDWDALIADIKGQNAVLLLGHGFLPGAQKGLMGKLQEKLGARLLHTYERDGLFLFADPGAKVDAQREASQHYDSCTPPEGLLRKVVEIPFPLIISANPDQTLFNTFKKYRLPIQFDYFSSNYKSGDYSIEKPTANNPLLYNLCGSLEDRESMILDFDDLFMMLKDLLSDQKVPLSVKTRIQKTTTYIFIGFHFERWYTQLFMRYLNRHDNHFSNSSSNYVLNTKFTNKDDEEFFLEQFKVKYIGADTKFFEEVYKRFKEKYPDQLRKLTDFLSPDATKVVQLVEKADFPSAFQMMKKLFPQLDADDQTLLSITESEFSQYRILMQEGTSTQENLNIMLNRVKKNLIELAKKLA